MTGEERVAYLVKLAMEAFDAFHRGSAWNGSPVHPGRAKYERLVTERMRQGAMVWGAEVDCAGDSK
jgi:hypothetical protein